MGCCLDCLGGIVVKIFQIILSLIKIGCAICIIVVVAVHLTNVTYDAPGITDSGTDTSVTNFNFNTLSFENGNANFDCLLGNTEYQVLGTGPSTNLCVYAYVVSGASLIVSFLLSLFLCITCDCCGCGFIFETLLAAAGTAWWLAASLVFTKYVADTNDNEGFLGLTSWRNSVPVVSWVAFAAFALTLVIAAGKIISKCVCCGGEGNNSKANAA